MGTMTRPGPRHLIRLMGPTVTKQSLLAALLITLLGATTAQAGYYFTFDAGPTPGPGGLYGTVNYAGPNDFSGQMNAAPFHGIYGVGTPLNSGKGFNVEGAFFSAFGNSGDFRIVQDGFNGLISNVNVDGGGGTFEVKGFLSPDAASFFGIDPNTGLSGEAGLRLTPSDQPYSYGNDIGFLELTLNLDPSVVVPEPSSLIATGSGLIVALGWAGGRRRRIGRSPRLGGIAPGPAADGLRTTNSITSRSHNSLGTAL
jgi:hypothetical protein